MGYTCSNGCKDAKPRIVAAREAACAFLDSYAASDVSAGTHRYVSLVTFATTASSWDLDDQTSGKQYWVDVTNADALARAKAVINGLSASGGTNTSGGMMLANNLFTQSSVNTPIAGITNKYAILLTDGKPTYTTTGTHTNVDSISRDSGDDGGNGSSTTKRETGAVETACTTLVDSTKVDLFAISYGLSGNVTNGSGKRVSITNWLQDDCKVGTRPADASGNPGKSDVFLSSNPSELNSAFDSILTTINNSGSDAVAATDTIDGSSASAPALGFEKFTNQNGASYENGTISWDLTKATADTDAPDGYTRYTMSYVVNLDNTQTSFVEGQSYSTGSVSFTFNDVSTGTEHKATSPAPAVKGYVAQLSFKKVSSLTENGEHPGLGGATFRLSATKTLLNETSFPVTVDVDSDSRETDDAGEKVKGNVVFDRIPSGFTYTLSEVAAPADFVASTDTWTVTVAYDKVTITDVEGNTVTSIGDVPNVPEQKYKNITVSKTWYMPAEPANGETTKAITVTLKRANAGEDPMTWTDFATLSLNGATATVTNCADSSVTVTATQNTTTSFWEYTVTVPDNNVTTGGSYEYSVEEADVKGFTKGGSGLALTNTSSGKATIYVQKQWIVPTNVTLTLPSTVQVEILRNGESFGEDDHTYINVDSADATGNDVYSIKLDAYDASGEYYTYAVSETSSTTYQYIGCTGSGTEADPYVLTNTVANETTPVSANKVWQDSGDSSQRPTSVTLQLLENEVPYLYDGENSTVTLTPENALEGDANTWSYDFGNLPKYKFLDAAGNETTDLSKVVTVRKCVYTVVETSTPTGYSASESGCTVTNTRTESGTITVTKAWKDGITGVHTGSVTVALSNGQGGVYETKTLSESNNWTASWENVQQFSTTGAKLVYTVTETSGLGNYAPTVDYGKTGTTANTSAVFVNGVAYVTVTNTPNGSDDTTSVTVNKTWNHPVGTVAPDATFTLYQAKDANGTDKVQYGDSVTLPASNTYTFSNLPKYYFTQNEETGASVQNAYYYTVTENAITLSNGDSYVNDLDQSGTRVVNNDGSVTYNVINTITGTVSVRADKEWIDLKAGTDSTRTAQATIQLQRSTDNTTWTDVSGDYFTTNVDHGATWSNLPKYSTTGAVYYYRVVENDVLGYTTVISGDTDTSDNFAFTVTNKLAQDTTGAHTVTKNWVDGGTAHASRPAITLTLKQGDAVYGTVTVSFNAEGKSVITVAEGSQITANQVSATISNDNTWMVYFNNLPQYNIGATSVTQYTYTADETEPAGYVKSVSGNTITNTLAQGTTSATVTKYWVDPTTSHPSVTFTLTATNAQGQTVTSVGGVDLPAEITLTEDAEAANESETDTIVLANGAGSNTWSYTISGLPKYDDGRSKISYTFTEKAVPGGYHQVVVTDADGKTVPNTFCNVINQEQVPIQGTKTWNRTVVGDYQNPAAVGSILVALYRDGSLVPTSEITVPTGVTAANPLTVSGSATEASWSFDFGTVDQYDINGDGHEYTYTVREVYYETVTDEETGEEKQVLRTVTGEGTDNSITYGNDRYTVAYGDGNTISNTFDQPQKYWYRVDTSYTTKLSGATIFSYSSTGEPAEVTTTDHTVTVDPDTYATLNGVAFALNGGKTYIDVTNGEDVELRTINAGATSVSVTVDQINRLYVIHLEYGRELYTLTTNYYYAGTTTEVYPTTVDPDVDSEKPYTDPGQYLGNASFTTERKAAPTGYELVSVKVNLGDGSQVQTLTPEQYAALGEGGTFNNADVTVTYYYDKITLSHYTVTASVTFTKKGDSGETAASGSNSEITNNAVFSLYSNSMCNATAWIKDLTIGADGTLTITAGTGAGTDLAAGTYYLKETSAPTGYEMGETAAGKVYTIVVASADTSHWTANNTSWQPQTTWTITVDGVASTTTDNYEVVNEMLKATYTVRYHFETGVNTNTYESKTAYPDLTNLTITWFDTVSSSTYELGKTGMGSVPTGYSLNTAKTGPATLTYAMVTGDPAQNVIDLYYDLDMTYVEGGLSITKSWIGTAKTATVALYETVDGVEAISSRADAVQTVSTAAPTAAWSNLENYTADGKAITYAVYEVSANGDGTYTKLTGAANSNIITIDGVKYLVSYDNDTVTNRELKNDITVKKTWTNVEDSEKTEVRVKLYANDTLVTANALGEAVGVNGVITLNGNNNFQLTISNLPATNEQGTALTYTVKELNASGAEKGNGDTININNAKYRVTVTAEGDTITLDNAKEKAGITVSKTANASGTYKLGVYTYDAAAKTYTLIADAAPLTVDTEHQQPSYTFGNLSAGAYYVKEDNAGKTFHNLAVTYSVNGETVEAEELQDGYVKIVLAKDQAVSVNCDNQYTYVPNNTSIAIEKVFADGYNRDGNRPDSITVAITDRTGKSVDSAFVITKNAEGKYTATKTFDANGYTGPYTVTEKGYTIGETYTETTDNAFAYTVSYASGTDDGLKTDGTVVNGAITITNTYEPETLVIPVVKTWSGSYSTKSDSVTLELVANGQPTGLTVVLTANNAMGENTAKWYGEFRSNYDAATDTGYTIYRNENGQPITYTVRETKMGDHEMTGTTWGYWTATAGTSTVKDALGEYGANMAEDALVLTMQNNYYVPTDPYTPPAKPIDPTPVPTEPEPPIEPDPEEVTEIEPEEVPLAPKTGDVSALWLALTAASAGGIAGLALLGKRKKNEE